MVVSKFHQTVCVKHGAANKTASVLKHWPFVTSGCFAQEGVLEVFLNWLFAEPDF